MPLIFQFQLPLTWQLELKYMKSIELTHTVHVFEDYRLLGIQEEIDLCTASIDARKSSYSVYSGFQVGAAVLLNDGRIIQGSNQENAVYPLGLCAERVAIFSANQLPGSNILKLAVSTSARNDKELPAFPCGSCRQVIAEEEAKANQPIKLFILHNDLQVYVVESVQALLPFAFDRSYL